MPFKGVLGGFNTVHKVEKDVKGKLKKFLRNPNFLFLVQISTPVTFPLCHMLKKQNENATRCHLLDPLCLVHRPVFFESEKESKCEVYYFL